MGRGTPASHALCGGKGSFILALGAINPDGSQLQQARCGASYQASYLQRYLYRTPGDCLTGRPFSVHSLGSQLSYFTLKVPLLSPSVQEVSETHSPLPALGLGQDILLWSLSQQSVYSQFVVGTEISNFILFFINTLNSPHNGE